MTTRNEPRVRRDLFVYLSGPMTAAHGYRVEDNVAAGVRVFFACVARGIPAFSPHASRRVHHDVGDRSATVVGVRLRRDRPLHARPAAAALGDESGRAG